MEVKNTRSNHTNFPCSRPESPYLLRIFFNKWKKIFCRFYLFAPAKPPVSRFYIFLAGYFYFFAIFETALFRNCSKRFVGDGVINNCDQRLLFMPQGD